MKESISLEKVHFYYSYEENVADDKFLDFFNEKLAL